MYGFISNIGFLFAQIWDKLLDPSFLTSPFWAVILLAVGMILTYKLVKWLINEKFKHLEEKIDNLERQDKDVSGN